VRAVKSSLLLVRERATDTFLRERLCSPSALPPDPLPALGVAEPVGREFIHRPSAVCGRPFRFLLYMFLQEKHAACFHACFHACYVQTHTCTLTWHTHAYCIHAFIFTYLYRYNPLLIECAAGDGRQPKTPSPAPRLGCCPLLNWRMQT
jgi:hypothetical protein